MATWIHVVISHDEEAGTVECRNCGTVRAVIKSGKPKCSVARAEQRNKYGRFEPRDRRIVELGYKCDGFCESCGDEIVGTPQVDHDHATGAARGYLCRNCNLLLGYAKDDPARLLAAIRYLAR